MNEHQKQTAFLKHVIGYDDSGECRELEKEIARVQRDECCVHRAAWLMALFAALMAMALAYGTMLRENFPHNESQHLIRAFCSLGLGSLICFVTFMSLSTLYRRKLNGLREQCRQLIKSCLESRLGEARITTLRGSHSSAEDGEVAPGVVDASRLPRSLDS